MDIYQINSILLQQIMLQKGYKTIGALADAAGVNRDTVARIVNGKGKPQTAVMYAIAGVLCMTSEQCGQVFFAQHIA